MLTEEQLQMRQSGIGASEAPAVLNLSPWKTPFQVWLEKETPTRPPLVINDLNSMPVKVGNALEPALRNLYSAEKGIEVVESGTLRHSDYPFVLATPDGLSVDGTRGLEIKVVGSRSVHRWEESESGVPFYVEVQCRQNMAVTGRNYWDVAALFGGNDLRIFTIKRDLDIENQILDGVALFWETYVLGDVPPPEDDAEARRTYLNALYPKNADKALITPSDPGRFIDLCEGLSEISAELKDLEARKKAIENNLIEIVGNAYGAKTDGYKFTYGTQAGGVGYKAIAEAAYGGSIPADIIEKHRSNSKRVARFTTP